MKVCFCFTDKWDQEIAAGDSSSPAAPSPVLSDSAVQLFRELNQQTYKKQQSVFLPFSFWWKHMSKESGKKVEQKAHPLQEWPPIRLTNL